MGTLPIHLTGGGCVAGMSDEELEYKIAPWSNVVKEVKICREFCRQILL